MRRALRVATALGLGLAAQGKAQSIDTVALAVHARVLAADSLLGRGTATPGTRQAAAYIASRLDDLGLEPLGRDSFLDPVPLLRVRLEPESRVVLNTPAGARDFLPGRDFVVVVGGSGALRGFAGPVVFLPSGSAPDPDDLAGTVLLLSEPPGEAMSARLRQWIRAGVAGAVVPVADDAQFARLRSRADQRLVVDASVDETVWQPDLPIIHAGPDLVRALVAGATRPRSSAPVPLHRTLEADLRFRADKVPEANVAGLVAGTDPDLRRQTIVLTAHYDHLGIGPAIDGDSIYNGFSDNAAGVAMLLEIAATLRADPPARSVAFLFTTGEERGLLGSSAWVADPPFPLDRVVAVLNLDAGAPPAPPVRWRVAGDTTAAPVRAAAEVVERNGWTADLTGANANSDHWPFMARGIPTIFLVPGRDWEGLGADARDRLFARWDRYHHPGDESRPGFPLAGLQRYASLALDIVRELAN